MAFAMSMNNLSIDGEFRYIIQWFNEWSELQRDDFIPVLVDLLTQDSSDVVYVNGAVNAVANSTVSDKPMNLFQCRMKLFREWTPKWSSELKQTLKEKIIEIDPKVGEKIISEMKSAQSNACPQSTGNDNGEIDLRSEFITPAATAAPGTDDTVQNTDIELTSTSIDNDEGTGTSVNTPHVVSLVEPLEQVQISSTDSQVLNNEE